MEKWKKFREIEKLPNVAWVRVTLHDDTEFVEEDGMERLNLVGDSVIVCTDMELSMSGNCVGLGLDCDLWKKASIDEFYR